MYLALQVHNHTRINYLTKIDSEKRTHLPQYLANRGPDDNISGRNDMRLTNFSHF